MAERKRNKEIHFYVTEEERKLIRRKMIESKTKNMGAYLRKMAIDGYIDVYKRQLEGSISLVSSGSSIKIYHLLMCNTHALINPFLHHLNTHIKIDVYKRQSLRTHPMHGISFWLLLYTSLYISYTKFPFHFCFNFIC